MPLLARYGTCLGVLAIVGAGSLVAPAEAANPQLVAAKSTMSKPNFISPTLTWDASLGVPFQIVGLGNNTGLTVTLNASVVVSLSVGATGSTNELFGNFGYTQDCSLSVDTTSDGGSASSSLDCFQTTATLTSDKNGNVKGRLTLPGSISGSIPDNLACAQVSWTNITLTFGNQSVALPDVSRKFDSTGSFCPSFPVP